MVYHCTMSEAASPYRTAGEPDSPSDEEVAKALAARLIRSAPENGPDAAKDRAELATVSRAISDLVADDFVGRMKRDALEVCAVFSNHTFPIWFKSSRDKLVAGLEAVQAEEPLVASFIMVLGTLQLRREEVESASTSRRLLSVLGRAWVVGFVWLPALALIAGALTVDSPLRIALFAGAAALFGLAFLVDARIRRCPSCRRYLAAMAVGSQHTGSHVESVQVTTASGTGYVNQKVDSYATLWRCVHCKHRWGG